MPEQASAVEVRKAARVVLLDSAGRILLLHGHEPLDPSATWWFTPGGGVEEGESPVQAARREVVEETGIADFELGPVLWLRHSDFSFAGRRWVNDESYYLGRVRGKPPDTALLNVSGRTELERASVGVLRWWSWQELTVTAETIYPERLGELLRDLLRFGPPASPLVLEPQAE